jgi:hypothetical protein
MEGREPGQGPVQSVQLASTAQGPEGSVRQVPEHYCSEHQTDKVLVGESMNNNGVIKSLTPGQKVELVLVDGRIFKGTVVGNETQKWVAFQDGHGVTSFTIQASRLSRLGTLEVVE